MSLRQAAVAESAAAWLCVRRIGMWRAQSDVAGSLLVVRHTFGQFTETLLRCVMHNASRYAIDGLILSVDMRSSLSI
jgi:hypothetical protein